MPKPKITIIGGGIGGLALAIGLHRRSVPVQIYEAAPAFTEVGLGLTLGPAAYRAMLHLDPRIQSIYDSLVTTHADSPGYEQFAQTWFEIVWASGVYEGDVLMNLKALPSGQTAVRRADFLKALVALLPQDMVHFGKRLVSLVDNDDSGGGGVELKFEDGEVVNADVVIGCDGIKSKVKEYVLPESQLVQPRYSGMYGYRAVLDMDEMVDAVGEKRARVSTLYVGKGCYGISYPIMRAKKVNVGIYVLNEEWEYESWVRLARREDMLRDTADMGRYVKALVEVCLIFFSWLCDCEAYRRSICLIRLNGRFSNIRISLRMCALVSRLWVMLHMLLRRTRVLGLDRRLKMRMFLLSF